MERRSGLACLVAMVMLCVGGVECQKSILEKKAECYGITYNLCRIANSTFYCAGKAFSECTTSGTGDNDKSRTSATSDDPATHKQQYCELGCALTRCTNITTTQLNPNVDQLGKCFESCSENTCKSKVSGASTNGGNGGQIYSGFCKLGCAATFCPETVDKGTVCGPCATACSLIPNGDV